MTYCLICRGEGRHTYLGLGVDCTACSGTGEQPVPQCETQATHKLNSDQSVAVSTEVFWNEDMATCPRGVKVQLLGAGGIALYGTYDGKDPFFMGWSPVPRRGPSC